MKKTLTSVVAAFVISAGALLPGQANAFCITFDGFCDQVDASYDPSINTLYGWWDLFCDGTFPQAVMGAKATMNVGIESALGLAGTYSFNTGNGTWFNVFWDTFSPPFFWLSGTYTLSGACGAVDAAAPKSWE